MDEPILEVRFAECHRIDLIVKRSEQLYHHLLSVVTLHTDRCVDHNRLQTQAFLNRLLKNLGRSDPQAHHLFSDRSFQDLGFVEGDQPAPVQNSDSIAAIGLIQKMGGQQNGDPLSLPE